MQLYKFTDCGCVGLGPDKLKDWNEFLILKPCLSVNIFELCRLPQRNAERMTRDEKCNWIKKFREDNILTLDATIKLQKIKQIILEG